MEFSSLEWFEKRSSEGVDLNLRAARTVENGWASLLPLLFGSLFFRCLIEFSRQRFAGLLTQGLFEDPAGFPARRTRETFGGDRGFPLR
jgi:hypothetical protein